MRNALFIIAVLGLLAVIAYELKPWAKRQAYAWATGYQLWRLERRVERHHCNVRRLIGKLPDAQVLAMIQSGTPLAAETEDLMEMTQRARMHLPPASVEDRIQSIGRTVAHRRFKFYTELHNAGGDYRSVTRWWMVNVLDLKSGSEILKFAQGAGLEVEHCRQCDVFLFRTNPILQSTHR